MIRHSPQDCFEVMLYCSNIRPPEVIKQHYICQSKTSMCPLSIVIIYSLQANKEHG